MFTRNRSGTVADYHIQGKEVSRKKAREKTALSPLFSLSKYIAIPLESALCAQRMKHTGFRERFTAITATFSAAIALFICASPRTAIVSTSPTLKWNIGTKCHVY